MKILWWADQHWLSGYIAQNYTLNRNVCGFDLYFLWSYAHIEVRVTFYRIHTVLVCSIWKTLEAEQSETSKVSIVNEKPWIPTVA